MRVVSALLLLVATGACSLAGGPLSARGRQTVVRPVSGKPVSGELVAASRDSVWLLTSDRLLGFSAQEVSDIAVRRLEFGGRYVMTWMATAGLAMGIGLAKACDSYNHIQGEERISCGSKFVGPVVVFLLGGAVMAGAQNARSRYRFGPLEIEQARRFARFPQGLPDTLRITPLPPPAGNR